MRMPMRMRKASPALAARRSAGEYRDAIVTRWMDMTVMTRERDRRGQESFEFAVVPPCFLRWLEETAQR